MRCDILRDFWTLNIIIICIGFQRDRETEDVFDFFLVVNFGFLFCGGEKEIEDVLVDLLE